MCLTVPFPTTKAYGVTTAETARALEELGHTVEFIAPSPKSNWSADVSRLRENLLPRLARIPLEPQRARLRFWRDRQRILREAQTWLRESDSVDRVLWLRDLWLASRLRSVAPRATLVVEIHMPFSRQDELRLSRADGPLTLWAPISPYIADRVHHVLSPSVRGRVHVAPMGVRNDFFRELGSPAGDSRSVGKAIASATYCGARFQHAPIRLGYFGGLTSSGHDQGVLDLIALLRDTRLPSGWVGLLLAGLNESESQRVLRSTSGTELGESMCIFPRLEHKAVPDLMHGCDVLVLPHSSSDEFLRGKFPIKLVEYAAVGRPILAREGEGLREVAPLGGLFVYANEDPESLRSQLELVANGGFEVSRRIRIAQEWALQHTYQKRVEGVLRALPSGLR